MACMPRSDEDWLKKAYEFALSSPDPRTQNGCVIVGKENCVITYGCNRYPIDAWEFGTELTPEKKGFYLLHGEVIAVANAARYGGKLYGATLYTTWRCCSYCANTLIEAGIKRVVGHKAEFHVKNALKWQEDMDIAERNFKNAGVDSFQIEKYLGVAPIRFAGEIVSP